MGWWKSFLYGKEEVRDSGLTFLGHKVYYARKGDRESWVALIPPSECTMTAPFILSPPSWGIDMVRKHVAEEK